MNMILDKACCFLTTHLTQIPKIEEIVVNPNFTGVLLENQDMGMAMNIRKGVGNEAATSIKPIEDLIGFGGFSGLERLSEANDPLMLSVRVALINALSKPFMTAEFLQARGYETARGRDSYSIKERVKDKTVVIVGFGGNVTRIASRAAKVYVTELEPEQFYSRVFSKHGASRGPFCATVIHARDAKPYFQKADAVVLTGCTLVTGTMEGILAQCRGKEVFVYGVTAGFFPEPLFDMGVEAIAPPVVTDSSGMMDALKNCGPMVERFFSESGQELFIQKNK